MSFQSISYLLFLIIIWIGTNVYNKVIWRQLLLLVASYLFYLSWSPTFILLLLAASLFNFVWGKLLRRHSDLLMLWVGLLVNISLLCFFKYADALLVSLGVSSPGALPYIVMPIGLSFYTFQAMSYLIEIYRGYEEEPTIIEFLLYMAFFPTILSGPICRAPEIIPQFRLASYPDQEDLANGCRRIIIGLFQKLVLADTLDRGFIMGEGVRFGFDRLTAGWGGVDVWFLAVGFGFQLFFDFAGYSNIAIGSARLFGFRLRENFNDPYFSQTPSEFWTRWHMSLSSWIRDYLFFPLAMLRRSPGWRYLALVIAMTIFGIWHGVGVTFLLWGIYHGLVLVAHRYLEQFTKARPGWRILTGPLGTLLSWGLTFAVISLGWVIFRANSLSQASNMIMALFSPGSYTTLALRPNFYIMVSLFVTSYFAYIGGRELLKPLRARPVVSRLAWLTSPVYYAVVVLAIIIWSKKTSTFIYFQF